MKIIEKVFADQEQLAKGAAQLIIEIGNESIKDHGFFALALAGGKTPGKTYETLASEKFADKIDWDKVHFFFGDERIDSVTDDNSNYKFAQKSFLYKLKIKEDQIHKVNTDLKDYEDIALSYENDIKDFFDTSIAPSFDLIILGLGSDGHTASLFPGKVALNEEERLVVYTDPGILPPQVDRVTFTLPLINKARNTLFLVADPNKKGAFYASRNGKGIHSEDPVPASRVKPLESLYWYIDKETKS